MVLFSTSHSLITAVLSCCLNAWHSLWVLEPLVCLVPFLSSWFCSLLSQGSVLWSSGRQLHGTWPSVSSPQSPRLKGLWACTAAMALGDYGVAHRPSWMLGLNGHPSRGCLLRRRELQESWKGRWFGDCLPSSCILTDSPLSPLYIS